MKQFPSLYEMRQPNKIIDLKALTATADAHAFEIWGDVVARDEPFPVMDENDKVFAYVFPYAIGVRTYPAEAMLSLHEQDSNKHFGAIYVSAQRITQPVLRVIHALHPVFLRGKEAEMIGHSILSDDAHLNKIYWLGFQEYFEVTAGDQRLLMDVYNLKQVTPEALSQDVKIYPEQDKPNAYWNVAKPVATPKEEVDIHDREAEVAVKKLISPIPGAIEPGGNAQGATMKLVPLSECVPVVNWTWWCVPTAFTMATCYYDNYNKNIGGITGYGRLASYWMDHSKSGHNVPDFIDQLIDPKTGTWRTGFNDFTDFIKKTYGYSFNTRNVSANASNDWAWKDITAEIDAGRPFVWGVPNHATCAFGYRIASDGSKRVIIYTTWGNTSTQQREEWLYTKGTGLTAIIPGGGTVGNHLEVWQPDGGETLLTNVPTTIRWYVWGNLIKEAELLSSTDGGKTWTTIAHSVPCVNGWNYFDWTPLYVNDYTRIRIRGLDANGTYIAGDGSHTNIKVLPGPRPVKLKTILVKAKTDAAGFFSAPHGLEHYTPDGYTIRAISVAVQHQNGNWHNLEFSHSVDNRFWWNKEVVAGVIASPSFFGQSVQIVISAEFIVG